MAVELKISVQENCDSMYVFDQTGKYDSKCNKTGWGSPNEYKISDATSAVILVYPPGVETPIEVNVYPDFPNDEKVGYEILPEDLGLEKFTSGVWRFDYQVRVSDGTLLFVSCQKLFVEDIKCCIEGNRISLNTENFESEKIIKQNNTTALFESAVDNSCHGRTDEADKIIEFLYIKCKCPC